MSDADAGLINSEVVGVDYESPPPAPTVTSIVQASAPAGEAFTLHVYGTGFGESAQVRVGGNRPATTFVSDGELTIDVDANRTQGIEAGQTLDVWVDNAPGTTNSVAFTFADDSGPPPDGGAPTITSLDPEERGWGADAPPFTLHIYGTGYTPAVVVWFDGVAVNTGYVSESQVDTSVDRSGYTADTDVPVWVVDAGGQSNTATFHFVGQWWPGIAEGE